MRQIKELSGHDDVVKALHDWMDADQKVTVLEVKTPAQDKVPGVGEPDRNHEPRR